MIIFSGIERKHIPDSELKELIDGLFPDTILSHDHSNMDVNKDIAQSQYKEIKLLINVAIKDNQAREYIASATISNLPLGVSLSKGVYSSGVWKLVTGDIENLSFRLPDSFAEELAFDIDVCMKDSNSLKQYTLSQNFVIPKEFSDKEVKIRIEQDGSITENTWLDFSLNTNWQPVEGFKVEKVIITNLDVGTYFTNQDEKIWELKTDKIEFSIAQIQGLKIKPPINSSKDLHLDLRLQGVTPDGKQLISPAKQINIKVFDTPPELRVESHIKGLQGSDISLVIDGWLIDADNEELFFEIDKVPNQVELSYIPKGQINRQLIKKLSGDKYLLHKEHLNDLAIYLDNEHKAMNMNLLVTALSKDEDGDIVPSITKKIQVNIVNSAAELN